ncbi:ISAs1 family transposase [Azospirillum humicireducens]|uniref:ISAs1 family transposase n=1 Tax=Azospirillum humicireducens TaxID=1226968 RepID=UPI0030032094
MERTANHTKAAASIPCNTTRVRNFWMRYYLCSTTLDAETFARAVRAHWGIENRLHWVLDVVFHDDLTRLRSGNGPQNMAIIRHIAMNLVRMPADKQSLKVRRKRANLDPDYLERLIRQSNTLT